MCNVVRSFMPVGQGAFYVEQFDTCSQKINLVFDCGSSTNCKLLHNNIDGIFQKEETIHAVFISHLHEDHISGLKYLLSKYRVEKIYFPLLNCKEKTIVLLHYLSSKKSHSTNDFFFKFVNDPYASLVSEGIRTDGDINYVVPYGHDISEYGQQYGRLVHSGKNVAKDIKGIKCDDGKWEIVPFNLENEQRTKDLIKQLEFVFKIHFPTDNIHIGENFDLGYYWRNHPRIRNDIKEAYRGINGTLNTNSMVVFSGIKTDAYQHFCESKTDDCYQCDSFCSDIYKSGCLYTGDYDCSNKMNYSNLDKAYSDYWDSIGCITIPHHGSQHNYNPCLTDNRRVFCIISAGTKNAYQHPHASVVKDLLQKRIPTFLINENPKSKFQTHICW